MVYIEHIKGVYVLLHAGCQNYIRPVFCGNNMQVSRIVSEMAGVNSDSARKILEKCAWKVKTAITMIKCRLRKDESNKLLSNNDGILRKALMNFKKIK